MPFPKFDYCIVCEGVRQEVGNKLAIFGFFGVAPNVQLRVAKMAQPVPICFVLGFGQVSDPNREYKHEIAIISADGSTLLKTPSVPAKVSATERGVLAMGAVVPFPVAGLYRIRVSINGSAELETTFSVVQARPEELAGML
jgi:hypothetical protein